MAIVCKSRHEVDIMQRNSQILVAAVDAVESLFSPGVSTLKMDEEISQSIFKAGGKPAMKGYFDYPSSICTSLNEQVVNTPPSRRVLQKGDLLKLEVGMVKDG